MKKKKYLVVSLLLLGWLFSCAPDSPPDEFLDQIAEIKEKWAPDKRIRVFDIEYKYETGKWHVFGETSVPEAKSAISKAADNIIGSENVVLDLKLLPDETFGDTITALVNVSVGNLKRTPGHSSELVDQVLMGMPVRILKRRSYWYLIQTPYEYLGWITQGTIERLTLHDLAAWNNSERVEISSNYCQVFQKPTPESPVVSDLVLGCVVKKIAIRGSWMEVRLPDGRSGYLKTDFTRPYIRSGKNSKIDRKELVKKAKTMMGIPYIWGGNSTKGLDCSGFTGNVFRWFGFQLPRDANMQVKLGEEIFPADDYSNILPGDLIFFGPGSRITHVGICLGGSYFIHSSGDVRINSLDKEDALYSAYRKNSFKYIKRIITD